MNYIGRTKQSLKSMLTKHKRCIKYQRPDQSALCEHSMTMDHKIDLENIIILNVETNYNKRLFVENCLINSKLNVINQNNGNSFLSIYKKLLDCNSVVQFSSLLSL